MCNKIYSMPHINSNKYSNNVIFLANSFQIWIKAFKNI